MQTLVISKCRLSHIQSDVHYVEVYTYASLSGSFSSIHFVLQGFDEKIIVKCYKFNDYLEELKDYISHLKSGLHKQVFDNFAFLRVVWSHRNHRCVVLAGLHRVRHVFDCQDHMTQSTVAKKNDIPVTKTKYFEFNGICIIS